MSFEYFSYREGTLHCEAVPVKEIVSRTGTPVYIYSRAALLDRYREIKRAFAPCKPLVCFSVKANSNINLLRVLARRGSGFDVVSGGELYRALQAGALPRKIVFAGVGKTAEEIAYALESGILIFNVESEEELAQIDEVARKKGRRASVALRLNPDVEPGTHRYLTTGKKETKFGIDIGTAREIVERIKNYPGVRMRGIHMHIGSQITDPSPYARALRKGAEFVEYCREKGVGLRYMNIGGGFGIQYDEKPAPPAARFAEKILPIVEKTGLRLILEPGRFIVGNAGILVTSVIYTKPSVASNGKIFAICDAAMNDLIRPTLYHAYHRISPVELRDGREEKLYDIVGPVCESGDFLAKERKIPAVTSGDLLCVFSAGAYGFSMSSNYNSRPRACEVLVAGRNFAVIRRRETYEDLIKPEKSLRCSKVL